MLPHVTDGLPVMVAPDRGERVLAHDAGQVVEVVLQGKVSLRQRLVAGDGDVVHPAVGPGGQGHVGDDGRDVGHGTVVPGRRPAPGGASALSHLPSVGRGRSGTVGCGLRVVSGTPLSLRLAGPCLAGLW